MKEYLNEDYRDIVELVEVMNKIKSRIGIKQVPHFTTLHKFVTRLNPVYISRLLQQTLKLFCSHGEKIEITAIDSSVLIVVIVATIIRGEQKRNEDLF